MKKSKVIFNSVIILFLSIILVWYFLKDNYKASLEVLQKANFVYLIFGIIIYMGYFIFETFLIKKLVNIHKKDYSFKSALKLYLMTKFFNGITPFSSGGQPLQLYELKKEGVSYQDGMTVLIKHFIILQVSVVSLGIISLFITLSFSIIKPTGFLLVVLIMGFVINLFLLLMVIFLSYKISICEKVCTFFINIFGKLKIIKNPDDAKKNIIKSCEDYQKNYRDLMKNKKYFIKLVLIESIALVCCFSLAFFVFKSLGSPYNNYIVMLCIATLVFLIGSFVPIPGGTGGMEYAFINLNEFIVPYNYLSISLILWRVIDYYFPMIFGGIFFNIENAKRDFKNITK